MNKKRICLWLTFIFCCIFLPLRTGYASEEILNLSLDECIDHVLRENLNLKGYYLGLQSSTLSIVQAESEFDPSLSLAMARNESVAPNFYQYYDVDSIESYRTNLDFTFGQHLSTGANWGFGLYNTISESNIETEKNYMSNLGFQINQPILRGFGKKINRSNIYIARISNQSSVHDLENIAINLIYEVQAAYWNFVYARETMEVREISLSQADSLLAYNKKGLELGVMIKADVLEAQSEQVARQQEVLTQKNIIRDQEDILRRLLNITSKEEWELTINPTDKPGILTIDLDSEAALDKALKQRPDYKIAQKIIETNEIDFAIAKNSRLPSLNLTANYRFNGSGESLGKDLKDLGNTEEYGWSLGFLLSYPLRNRSAEADYEKKKIDIKRAQLILEDIKNQIIIDIRSSIRNITISREQVDVAELSVEVNELRLKEEEERFRNKLSSSYFVLEFQRDLADSRNLYNKALIDYTIALADFQRAKGTLLKDLNISIIANNR